MRSSAASRWCHWRSRAAPRAEPHARGCAFCGVNITMMPSATIRRPLIQPRLVATVTLLVASLASGVLVHWAVAAVLLIAGLGIIHRPLDLFLTCVLIAGAATFVDNEGGHLPRDLSLVMVMTLYGLFCLQLHAATGRWSLPVSGLTIAL